jgi:DNA (cytosine-5)-methyltransferase 1
MNFRFGELFCGAGGLAWGAFHARPEQSVKNYNEIYKISHAWANDLDQSACRTYAANLLLNGTDNTDEIDEALIDINDWCTKIEKASEQSIQSVICGGVEVLTEHADSLPDIDGLAFGFPCNDFSAVGERKGLSGAFGPLYKHSIKVLNAKKPRWFVAENVEGLLHSDKGRVWQQIKKELSQAGPGYILTSHIYLFEQYGVPQYRARLVVVGISLPDADQGISFRIPAPIMKDKFRTAKWAMEHDPIEPNVFKQLTDVIPNHTFKRHSDQVRHRLEHTLPGQNAWNANIPPEYALHVKKAHLSMIYRRLVADEPAYTITGNGGGGTQGYHWDEPRALTNRERARLQSFPDSYRFHGGEESIRRQIGMAVPPIAAKIIFEAILKTYAGQPYSYVDPNINYSSLHRRNDARSSYQSKETHAR